MNTTLRKSFCVIQLICMTSSVHADWASELKDIFKLFAIAGTSVFIYAKWFGQSKLVDNSSSSPTTDTEKNKQLFEERESLKKEVATLDQKKDNREAEVIESNSVSEQQNQADCLSGEGVEQVRNFLQKIKNGELKLQEQKSSVKNTYTPDAPNYDELFSLLNRCTNELSQLTEKQDEFENIIKQHVKIIGDGSSTKTFTDQHQSDHQSTEWNIGCESEERQRECDGCFQTLKSEISKLKDVMGGCFYESGKIISFVQFGTLLQRTIEKLCDEMDCLKSKTNELETTLTASMAYSAFGVDYCSTQDF